MALLPGDQTLRLRAALCSGHSVQCERHLRQDLVWALIWRSSHALAPSRRASLNESLALVLWPAWDVQ